MQLVESFVCFLIIIGWKTKKAVLFLSLEDRPPFAGVGWTDRQIK